MGIQQLSLVVEITL